MTIPKKERGGLEEILILFKGLFFSIEDPFPTLSPESVANNLRRYMEDILKNRNKDEELGSSSLSRNYNHIEQGLLSLRAKIQLGGDSGKEAKRLYRIWYNNYQRIQ